MRRTFAIYAAALSLSTVMSTAPAIAEDEPPELDRFYLRLTTGLRTLHRYVDCSLKRDPELARRIFDNQFGSAVQTQMTNELLDDHNHNAPCLFVATRLQASHLMFLGALADQLIDRDTPARPSRLTANSLRNAGGAFQWTWRNLPDRQAAQSLPLADCLVAGNPELVEAVLAARYTTNNERKAFNAMAPEIANCISLGETRTLQPQILRAALAVAYYTAARQADTTANLGVTQ